MRTNIPCARKLSSTGAMVLAALLSIHLSGMPAGWASPPKDGLPVPLYSFDSLSPSNNDCMLPPFAVLSLDFPCPAVAVPGDSVGIGVMGDNIDSLAASYTSDMALDQFVLLFSVDRNTIGAAEPDPNLVAAGVPYNMKDQAEREHAAGDQYMSLGVFDRHGLVHMRGGGNNTLGLNNFDEGGRDFNAKPQITARDYNNSGEQDNVNATSSATTNGFRGGDGISSAPIYFGLSAGSPSLEMLSEPNLASGANIFFNPNPAEPGSRTSVFAGFEQLGLSQLDDVDGLVVFDDNADGMFNGSDRVLYSLIPGSASLSTLPGGDEPGAGANVYMAVAGSAQPVLFASAAMLGLGESVMGLDNIDALDIFPCDDPLYCAQQNGIRFVWFDFDNDGHVTWPDFAAFQGCFTGAAGGAISWECEPGDADGDGDIDCDDWNGFQSAWDGVGPVPEFEPCQEPIPTMSEWAAICMALLLVAAGSVIVGRRRANVSG